MTWSSDWAPVIAVDPAAPAPGSAPAPGTAPLTQSVPVSKAGGGWTLADLSHGHVSPARSEASLAHAARQAADREARERQAELEEAYSRGYEEGAAEMEARLAERVVEALNAAETAAEALKSGGAAWIEDARQHICALAIAAARHILDREIRTDAHAVADIVRRALAQFPFDESVHVRVNPQDLSLISTAGTNAGGVRIAPGRNVQWVADPDLLPGGCIVEGRRRVVDGRIDHALERIYVALVND